MTDRIDVHLDASGLASGLAAAGTEMTRLAREEIAPAAALIEEAFARASSSIERSLARAARSGSLSLASLSRSLASDLKRAALDSLIRKPLESALSGALTGAFSGAFGGARAFGGFAARGHAYLVGERGPELFTPAASGRVAPAGAATTVNVTIAGVTDAASFRHSETQIAAALARAIDRGRRNG